jgi:glycosyltransferase involved in cell wall biosynthesis
MHVAMISYDYSPGFSTIEALFERYHPLTGWTAGLRAAGASVTVFQRFDRDCSVERCGVTYHFVADGYGSRLRLWQIPRRLNRLAGAAWPTLVHLDGLLYPLQTRALRSLLPARCPIVAQHHAERPRRGARGLLQRWGLRAVDGFLFAADELAQQWVRRGMIDRARPIYQIMEGSNWFQLRDREAARARTGMRGDPALLWVGRLDRNKDPLTVLAGFERALAYMPGARLYMLYGDDSLLPEVRARIGWSLALRESVELLGRRPYREMEDYYNSADFFILGSHYEGSGYALVEALACGLVPIVTDIPSFRMITDGGAIGALWPAGDSAALTAALRDLLRRPRAPQAAAARRFFEERLSYPSIGRQALAAYDDLVARRAGCAE